MSRSWTFKIYRSWDEVDDPSFLAQWEGWMEASPDTHVFNHPAMVKAWTDTYRSLQHISPLYVVGETEGVTAFMPLVLWRRNWKNAFLRMIVPAGYSDYDYHDPLVSVPLGDNLIGSFWEMLEDRVFQDRSLRYDMVDLQGMRHAGESRGWLLSSDLCPYAKLAEYKSYEDYLSQLKKSLRQDIGRQKKKLEQNGTLEYHVHREGVTDRVRDSFRLFMETHAGKWPTAYKAPGFHEALLRRGIQERLVHFSDLRLDDRPISWHLGFCCNARFYYYMPAYLQEFANYSPGKVHLSFLIEECFSEGVDIFDHLRGEENYKAGWANDSDRLYTFTASSSLLLSLARLTLFGNLKKLKETKT